MSKLILNLSDSALESGPQVNLLKMLTIRHPQGQLAQTNLLK